MDAEYSIVFLFLFVLKMPSIKYIHHYYQHQPSTSCCIPADSMSMRSVELEGGPPWGLRLTGGGAHALKVSRVNPGSRAAEKVREGDLISSINGKDAGIMSHQVSTCHLSAGPQHCTVLVRRCRCCSTPPAPACTWCSASSGGGWAAPGAWPVPARSTAATRQHSARWGQQPTVVEG